MKIRYIGIHTGGVYVTRDDVYVPHGGVVDVPDDDGASLLDQGGWEAVDPDPTPDADGVDDQED